MIQNCGPQTGQMPRGRADTHGQPWLPKRSGPAHTYLRVEPWGDNRSSKLVLCPDSEDQAETRGESRGDVGGLLRGFLDGDG
jgi:hypothetical protein